MLSTQVLVLNRSYIPIHVTSLKRAFTLLYLGIAKAVDHQYETFDFHSWSEMSVAAHHEKIGLIGRFIRVPRVILLATYNHVPRRHVRFSRNNIYLRDQNICQFCAKRLPRSDLNLDHVVPRALGGRTNWENVVTSCIPCNRKKGGLSPADAGMKLIRHPARPQWTPFVDLSLREIRYKEWKPFFNIVDFSYWNMELEE